MKKIKFLNILLLASLSFSYSCNTPPTEVSKPNTQGQALVGKKFVESFEPEYKVGMSYTYIVSSTNKDQLPETVITEIIEVKPPMVKVKFTSSIRGEQIKEDRIDNFDPSIPETGILNEGMESITVPAGTYDANKLSYFIDLGKTKAKTTIWLVKDIGAVKRIDIMPDTSSIISELKEFKK